MYRLSFRGIKGLVQNEFQWCNFNFKLTWPLEWKGVFYLRHILALAVLAMIDEENRSLVCRFEFGALRHISQLTRCLTP